MEEIVQADSNIRAKFSKGIKSVVGYFAPFRLRIWDSIKPAANGPASGYHDNLFSIQFVHDMLQ